MDPDYVVKFLAQSKNLALINLYQYFFDLLKKMSNMDAVDFKDLDKFIRQISLSFFHMEKCKVGNTYINFLISGRFLFSIHPLGSGEFFKSHCMHLLSKNNFNYLYGTLCTLKRIMNFSLPNTIYIPLNCVCMSVWIHCFYIWIYNVIYHVHLLSLKSLIFIVIFNSTIFRRKKSYFITSVIYPPLIRKSPPIYGKL